MDQRLHQAVRLAKGGQRENAQKIVHQLLKENPNDADAWYVAAYLTDNKSRQITILKRALTIDPHHLMIKQTLDKLIHKTDISVPSSRPRQLPQISTRVSKAKITERSGTQKKKTFTIVAKSKVSQALRDLVKIAEVLTLTVGPLFAIVLSLSGVLGQTFSALPCVLWAIIAGIIFLRSVDKVDRPSRSVGSYNYQNTADPLDSVKSSHIGGMDPHKAWKMFGYGHDPSRPPLGMTPEQYIQNAMDDAEQNEHRRRK